MRLWRQVKRSHDSKLRVIRKLRHSLLHEREGGGDLSLLDKVADDIANDAQFGIVRSLDLPPEPHNLPSNPHCHHPLHPAHQRIGVERLVGAGVSFLTETFSF